MSAKDIELTVEQIEKMTEIIKKMTAKEIIGAAPKTMTGLRPILSRKPTAKSRPLSRSFKAFFLAMKHSVGISPGGNLTILCSNGKLHQSHFMPIDFADEADVISLFLGSTKCDE